MTLQSPWYLKINPKGEVPALKHGNRIISGSDNILEYIEKQKLGKRSLVPNDSEGLKKYKYWMSKLDAGRQKSMELKKTNQYC